MQTEWSSNPPDYEQAIEQVEMDYKAEWDGYYFVRDDGTKFSVVGWYDDMGDLTIEEED